MSHQKNDQIRNGNELQLSLGIPWGIGSRTLVLPKSMDGQVPYIKWQYLPVSYTHPPVYFESFLDRILQYLIQCKCYINNYTVLFRDKIKQSVHVQYRCHHRRADHVVPVSNHITFFLPQIFPIPGCLEPPTRNPRIWRTECSLVNYPFQVDLISVCCSVPLLAIIIF